MDACDSVGRINLMRVWLVLIAALVACKSEFEERAGEAIPAIRAAIKAHDFAHAQLLCEETPVTGRERRDHVIAARELDDLCAADLPRAKHFDENAGTAMPTIGAAIKAHDFATAQRLCDDMSIEARTRRDTDMVARWIDHLCDAELRRARP